MIIIIIIVVVVVVAAKMYPVFTKSTVTYTLTNKRTD